MELRLHDLHNQTVAELTSGGVVIRQLQDAIDLLGNASYHGAQHIMIRREQLSPDFFDLSTGFAGEVLQKFSNYRVHLAIVGDFSDFNSKSLKDFIRESNRTGRIIFVSNPREAIQAFSPDNT